MHQAHEEFFSQAVVGKILMLRHLSYVCPHALCVAGCFPISALLSSTRTVHTVDFLRVSCAELENFEIPFSFRIDKTGTQVSQF